MTKYLKESDMIIDIMDCQKNAVKNCVGIKKIEVIGRADVYNMEVEDNHNFAVEGGLIVHNCMDATRYFVKTERISMERRRIGE